jgi:hypothetical protein
MALIDVYPTYWLRCRPHGYLFAAIDPIWGRPGEPNHLNCGLDNIEGRAVVIINEPDYDPKDRNQQRVLCCSECKGNGIVDGVLLALRMGEPPRRVVRLTCERCRGWGYR